MDAKKQNMNNVVDDKVSRLPDEILVSILSLITMKEAARTSVLSRRWIKLWSFRPILDFDASKVVCLLPRRRPERGSPEALFVTNERRKYVDWINLVIKSYKGPSTLDQFRVQFDLNAPYTSHIDRWVKFAIEKKVRSLVMDLLRHHHEKNTYLFPSLSNLDCSFLRKLYLKNMKIDGSLFEHLISACPHLEELAIIFSHPQNPVPINIVGPSLCLKRLKIDGCFDLKSICLSATNLSSFKYFGSVIDISYANVPNLVKVSMADFSFFHKFPQLPNFLPRLETLNLEVNDIKEFVAGIEFPKLPYLKNLKLTVYASKDQSLLDYASLLEAAPSLRKVKIIKRRIGFSNRPEKERKQGLKLMCLKQVEYVPFEGNAMDTEFVKYLLANVVMLERIIIDCLPPGHLQDEERRNAIKMHASHTIRHLSSQYSLGDKLVLLNF